MIAAYFAPTCGMLKRIARVGGRGRARVITAAKSDNTRDHRRRALHLRRLLQARGRDVRISADQAPHQAAWCSTTWSTSARRNFDIRSLYLNLEMMLRVEDPSSPMMMRVYFEGELADSLRITPAVQHKRATLAQPDQMGADRFFAGDERSIIRVTRRLNFGASGA